jgi:GST-like protein
MMMSTTIELHGARTGNCLRAAIALEEASIPYRVHRVDLRSGQQVSEGHLRLNPSGKVPTLLETSGPNVFALSQSNAIVFYAADKAPGKLLAVEVGSERALALERFFYFVTDVLSPGFDAFILRNHGDREGSRILEERRLEGLLWAERYAAQSKFIAGEHFTIADIVAYTFVASVEKQIDMNQLPNVLRWFREIKIRPGVERGMLAFD